MLASCINDDYDWSPMYWEGYGTTTAPYINVGSGGGSYNFSCKNYNNLTLTGIEERSDSLFGTTGDSVVYTLPQQGNDESNYTHITDSCAEVTCSGRDVNIVIKPNTTDKKRFIGVGVTAGDIFSSFYFTQDK